VCSTPRGHLTLSETKTERCDSVKSLKIKEVKQWSQLICQCTMAHSCNKRFLFTSTFFYVFNIFSSLCFLFKKRCQKQSMNMQKIHRETLLEDASAMIFIDFGLLRSHYCKISYLLKSADVTQIWWRHLLCKFWQSFLSNVHYRNNSVVNVCFFWLLFNWTSFPELGWTPQPSKYKLLWTAATGLLQAGCRSRRANYGSANRDWLNAL